MAGEGYQISNWVHMEAQSWLWLFLPWKGQLDSSRKPQGCWVFILALGYLKDNVCILFYITLTKTWMAIQTLVLECWVFIVKFSSPFKWTNTQPRFGADWVLILGTCFGNIPTSRGWICLRFFHSLTDALGVRSYGKDLQFPHSKWDHICSKSGKWCFSDTPEQMCTWTQWLWHHIKKKKKKTDTRSSQKKNF